MNKKIFSKVLLTALAVQGLAQAREIRNPQLALFAPHHYQPDLYVEQDDMDGDDCGCFSGFGFRVWGIGYYKSASEAFSNCDSTCRVPLTNLFFGASDFRLEQAFPGSDVGANLPINPFVSIATISPRYEYKERGAILGVSANHGYTWCDTTYNIGLRARLPIRDTEVSETCGGVLGGSDIEGETLADVFQTRLETIGTPANPPDPLDPAQTNTVFAARLDFLSAINRISLTSTGGSQPMVEYSAVAPTILIAQQDVGFPRTTPNQPVVAVIQRNDGSMPVDQRWGQQHGATAYGTGITGDVAGDGSGLANNQRGQFVRTTDYTALSANSVAQSRLFVVPTLQDTATAVPINQLTEGATAILAAISQSISGIQESVTEFLEAQGINICSGRSKGLGDLDLEFYIGRHFLCDDRLLLELQFGVTVPTSKALCDCKQVLRQPLGVNDHTQVRIGAIGAYDWSDRFKIGADFRYFWALKHCEQIAAPFAGATIKNIGPCINADVSWNYLLAHVDLTFMASDCCGFDIGYEVYHKQCDKICSNVTQAIPLGMTTPAALDFNVARRLTQVTSHKLYAEGFMGVGACQIFGGFGHSVAGRNAMRDAEWYLGMEVTF